MNQERQYAQNTMHSAPRPKQSVAVASAVGFGAGFQMSEHKSLESLADESDHWLGIGRSSSESSPLVIFFSVVLPLPKKMVSITLTAFNFLSSWLLLLVFFPCTDT